MSQSEKPYVLLVEDNESTIALIMALLQRDFTIEVASDGADGVEKLKTRTYAVIVLDVKMPNADGYAVLDFLTANNPEMIANVVVVTAALSAREVARVKEYPICALIPKPFEVDLLVAAVRHCTNYDRVNSGPFIASGVLLMLARILNDRWLG